MKDLEESPSHPQKLCSEVIQFSRTVYKSCQKKRVGRLLAKDLSLRPFHITYLSCYFPTFFCVFFPSSIISKEGQHSNTKECDKKLHCSVRDSPWHLTHQKWLTYFYICMTIKVVKKRPHRLLWNGNSLILSDIIPTIVQLFSIEKLPWDPIRGSPCPRKDIKCSSLLFLNLAMISAFSQWVVFYP